MNMIVLLGFLSWMLCVPAAASAQDALIHHDLQVILVPADHRITVVDTITLPPDQPQDVQFTLHTGLTPSSLIPQVRLMKKENKQAAVPLQSYSVALPPGLRTFVIAYGGNIEHALKQHGKEQARGFSDTPGIISPEGVYLSGSSGWYPDFGAQLVTFDLEVRLPGAWDAVSQGERTRRERAAGESMVRWSSPEPQDAIYLVAAPFFVYERAAGTVQAMVYLRSPDQALADKYLEATGRYLEMYSRLIGPYPYKKFALVENFWETGFGMPSFTLLGPKVVRLPFIINTSYPHEILHSWWGNSVYPDYEKGNWSEGLTAYLSDHLMKEQQGGGADYRVAALQKYADYVREGKDFPLTEFRSRHSPETEAVGYGKSLLFFHMLRGELGDELFRKGLREFYRKYKFRFAAFDDLRTTFEAVSGEDLAHQFEQWAARSGAPVLKLGRTVVRPEKQGYTLTARIEQTQPGGAYRLQVPVAVTMEGREHALQATVAMTGKTSEFTLVTPALPMRIDLDPEFDLFRRLGRDELPPAVSQALGAKRMLVVLPSKAGKGLFAAYEEFSRFLTKSGPDQVEVRQDNELKELPSDRAVFVLGWENRFSASVLVALSAYDLSVKENDIRISRTTVNRKDHSFVLATRSPKNSEMALVLVAADNPDALPGLAAKLPHYHKYSYLAFEGAEPVNVVKGRWPIIDSPLTAMIPGKKGVHRKVEMAGLALREPLATPASPYSKERMMETVSFLSSEDLAGRGFGSAGQDKAADHIAREFGAAGLIPAGDREGSWFQVWEEAGEAGRVATLKNVIGVIPGKKAGNVVIGAHYDHLGQGWPETRDKAPGTIHPGADDNASGVAVLIELARVFAIGPPPDRSIVFIAFAGEEAGRRGSKYFVRNEKRYPAADAIGMINLDTVGRLGKNRLLVLGAGSAREWAHIFRGAGFVTGVEVEAVSQDLDSSDQKSFEEAGVPAVQLFSGPNLDYHRSTDTADKIDPEGLVKVAAVAFEAASYLAGREGPLTTVSSGAKSDTPPGGPRKVSLGTIPDFAYRGRGFRISGVVPGSPAEAAGLTAGDVIITMNARAVDGLKGFSDILKTLNPGDKISVIFIRDGRELTVKTEVVAK